MAESQITTGGKERVKDSAAVLAVAFAEDPTFTWILNSMTKKERIAFFPKLFKAICMAAALNGGSFEEVGDWKSVAVLLPPGSDVGNPATLLPAGLPGLLWDIGYHGCKRMIYNIPNGAGKSKAIGLAPREKYYYLFMVGTLPEGRGNGYCSKLVRHYQSIGQRDQLPVWLEASSGHSHKLYEKLDFVTVSEINHGVGSAAADGTKCDGGPGVKLWGMIWRPTKSS